MSLTQVAERFACSYEADQLWRRLLVLHSVGIMGLQGRNWADWLPHNGGHSDLGTDARLLFIASVGCLTRLEEQGKVQEAGVALARLRLQDAGVTRERRRLGLCREDAWELVDLVKEWLVWALGEDNIGDEPELPWPDSVHRT